MPANAQGVRYVEQYRQTEYTIDEPYPGPRFLCALTTFMDGRGWHALREDPLNPGVQSDLIAGWIDGFLKPTRAPATLWMASWIDASDNVLTYALAYPKPTATTPTPLPATVSVLDWPPAWVRAALASTHNEAHAAELHSLQFPLARDITPNAPGCDETLASPLVKYSTRGTTPVVLPYELAEVHAVALMSDQSQRGVPRTLGQRISQAFSKNGLSVPVEVGPQTDIGLDVTARCHCAVPGVPKNLYVEEAVLYRPNSAATSSDGGPVVPDQPKRILFHWTDRGDPAWKHVPATCVGPQPLSPSCADAFEHADLAFVYALASAITAAKGGRR